MKCEPNVVIVWVPSSILLHSTPLHPSGDSDSSGSLEDEENAGLDLDDLADVI